MVAKMNVVYGRCEAVRSAILATAGFLVKILSLPPSPGNMQYRNH